MFRRLLVSSAAVLLGLAFVAAGSHADDKGTAPVTARYQVTGLFGPERVADLRDAFTRIADVTLDDIDYKASEVKLTYVPAKLGPNLKPAQVVERLDNLVKGASSNTFGIKPPRAQPLDQLKVVEIAVGGCDCKACNLAAYEAIFRLDGVERVTVSFRDGKATAHIDPAKTDQAALESALKKRGITVKAAAK